MQICFFEDALTSGLKPLTLTRPSNELRVGIFKIHEKWTKRLVATQYSQILPPRMNGVFHAKEINEDEDCIWINGRFLPHEGIENLISNLKIDEGFTFNNIPVVIRMKGRRSAGLFKAGNVSTTDISFDDINVGYLLNQSWEIFHINEEEIKRDIKFLTGYSALNTDDFNGIHVMNESNVIIGKHVTIEPGVFIHASDGPVFIGNNVHIMAGTMIRGPVAICEHTVLKMGSKMYGGTTLGPFCKIGGELNNVVIQGYSNKAHDGFLGNSVIGEWCNFGADTNNSNMKNNYSSVRLTDWESGREYDTELQFCGLIMGDHSKTAINSVLNTGTVCGVSSNIFSGKFPPKFIRSFRWMGPNGEDIYKFDKAMETAEKMMKRRDVDLTPEYRAMMRHLFEKANT